MFYFVSFVKKNTQRLSTFLFLLMAPSITLAAGNGTLQEIIKNASFFIQKIIIPLLFGIAFLFFLINMVRYYILGGDSEEMRTKAHRSMLYGLAAFVFLISIWGIVSLFVVGIGIDKDSTICPDYLKEADGSCGSGKTFTGGTSGGSFTGGPASTAGGSGAPGVSTGSSGGNNSFSGLAELIFGTGKDSALFSRYTGAPRAIYQTPQIASAASCTSGLNTLALSSRTETAQAAYVLYKNSTGSTQWKNITDLNSANHIAYDKDELDTLLSNGATNVYIIHTHPNSRTENLSLTMESHGPSAADFKAMCANDDVHLTYAVVGEGGIWLFSQNSDTCPYSNTAKNTLPIVESYAAIAALEASTRQAELFTYINDPVTPTQYKNYFSTIDTQELPNLTPEEMLALSNFYQSYASTTVTYSQAPATFCSSF